MSALRFLDFLKSGLPPLRRAASLDGALLQVSGPEGPLDVRVTIRPQAKRMVLKIDRRSGEPQLTLPRGVGRVRAERFLAQYSGWIATRLKALPQRVVFDAGAVLPLRGVPTRIVHSLPFRGETRLESRDGEACLVVHGAEEAVSGRVSRYLRGEALRDLGAASRHYAAKAGVSIGKISIKDTRSRWGSCSAKGDLAFSWRLILAPPFVLDYLAAHEVAHRLEMNHSTRYWRHLRALCPDTPAAEDWLKRHGASLHHYGP